MANRYVGGMSDVAQWLSADGSVVKRDVAIVPFGFYPLVMTNIAIENGDL